MTTTVKVTFRALQPGTWEYFIRVNGSLEGQVRIRYKNSLAVGWFLIVNRTVQERTYKTIEEAKAAAKEYFQTKSTDVCRHCGKPRGHHRSTDKACPFGKRHRTFGYTAYSNSTIFTPKARK
jgi:hypothetical protein